MTRDTVTALRSDIAAALKNEHIATCVLLLKRYIDIDPDEMFYRQLYGKLLCILGRSSEGERVLLSVRHDELSPGTKAVWERSVGSMYEETGRFVEAERWFRASVATEASDAASWVLLGTFLSKREMFDAGLRVLEEGLLRSESGPIEELYLNIGNIKRAIGDYIGASDAYRHALDIDPAYVTAKDRLLDVQNAAGWPG